MLQESTEPGTVPDTNACRMDGRLESRWKEQRVKGTKGGQKDEKTDGKMQREKEMNKGRKEEGKEGRKNGWMDG